MIVIIINDDHVNVEDIDKLSNYYNGARNSNSNDDIINGLHEIFNIMMIYMGCTCYCAVYRGLCCRRVRVTYHKNIITVKMMM